MNRRMKSYRDLLVWQKGMDLVVLVYRATAKWPKDELYGLTRQARDAVVSVPANTAEGYGRNSDREFRYFLGVAYGSLMEMETEIQTGQLLGYSPDEEVAEILAASGEVGRLINGLKASLNV